MSGITSAYRLVGRGGEENVIPVILAIIVAVDFVALMLLFPIPVISPAYLALVLITPGRRRKAASTCQKHLTPRVTTTASPLAEENVDEDKEGRASVARGEGEGRGQENSPWDNMTPVGGEG